jgi:hypothetical protein
LDKDGKPIADALVRLVSVGEPLPFAMIGKTDADGKTKITVNGKLDGAPAGKFRVLVAKNVGFDKTEGIPKPQPGTVVDVESELIRHTNIIYGNDKLSPLEIEVLPNQPLNETVKLTLSVSDKFNPRTVGAGAKK